jgi:hypothetical protein
VTADFLLQPSPIFPIFAAKQIKGMDTTTWLILLIIAATAIGVLYFMRTEKKPSPPKKTTDTPVNTNPETLRLKLQAYERLTILAERIGLKNLITRFNNEGFSARQLQGALIDAIKTEFEYNISQQIYVTPQIWEAVNNLKEQNIFIVNQITAALPPTASALDLSKAIVQFLDTDSNASLQAIVLQAISYEAKQLMQ